MPLRADIRLATRMLRRTPGTTTAAGIALALGIGAVSAMFAVVDAVLVRPLPYDNDHQLVVVLHQRANPVAPANFRDWQAGTRDVFAAMGAAEYWTPSLGSSGEREKVFALHVTPEMLPMLGVAPARGRLLSAAADVDREVVIADSLWRRRFGADPAIVGRAIELDGASFRVVGVMPPSFAFAPFWATRAELWAPLRLGTRESSRGGNSLRVFARLRSGVTIDRARTAIAATTAALERQYPGTNRNVVVTPLAQMVTGNVRPTLLMLFGAVALVLALACANVAHMLLARSGARVKEVAVRTALGAGRARLIRQFAIEYLLLAACGGAAGVALAAASLRVIVALAGPSVPRISGVALDARVLLFATAVAGASGLLFGLLPALRASRADLVLGLRDVDRGATSGRSSRRLRRLLIVSEVAFAIVLLAGAGVMVRSLRALRAVDPGFVPDRVLSMVVSVTGSAEAAPGRRSQFYAELLDRLRAETGIQRASAINHLPLDGDVWGVPFAIEGRPAPPKGDEPTATYRVVMPGYFDTMSLPILRGRDIDSRDTASAPPVVVVNQFLADRFWPGEDPIGKRIRIAGIDAGVWQTVIGVSRNAVRGDWSAPIEEEVYLPFEQSSNYRDGQQPHQTYMTLVARTDGDPHAAAGLVRATVMSLAPDVTISDVLALGDVVQGATSGAAFVMTLLTSFAGIALVLAAVGIYGVMSYDVESRRFELGVRLALGATPARVLWMVVRQGAGLSAIGLGLGLSAAIAVSGALRSAVYRVSVADPAALLIAATLLGGVAVTACYIPARRASHIDPQQTLR